MKFRSLNLLILLLLFIFTGLSIAQRPIKIMSYNVENLFLPNNRPNWGHKRYAHKLNQIARVITAVGEWENVPLVGICEIENDSVVHHLLTRTPLRNSLYKYFITTGSDSRGINIALLYQRDKFKPFGNSEYVVVDSKEKSRTTRNLLHVWGKFIDSADMIDIFVCHFPSRYGGEKESESFRLDAATVLKQKCDSINQIRHEARIIIMGDFNDSPHNKSMTDILLLPDDGVKLINLFSKNSSSYSGSHKYRNEWNQLDQILVSANLMDTTSATYVKPNSAVNFMATFLLVSDKTWGFERPFRSFHGFKYEGGFSDHLPVVMDLMLNSPLFD